MSLYTEMNHCVLCESPVNKASVLFDLGNDQKLLRCSACGLIYNDRCRNDFEKIYGNEYYEGFDKAISGGYFSYTEMERATNKTDRFATRLIQKACKGRPDNVRLLDIGCGYGYFLKQFMGDASFELIGIEASKSAADQASKTLDNIIHKTFEDVDFSEMSDFDFIAGFEVIEHLMDPSAFLRKIHNILKNGGYLFMSTPDIGSYWFKMLGRRWPGIHPFHHNVYFSKKTLRAISEKYGFEIVKMRSRWYYYTNVRHIRKRLFELFPLFGRVFGLLKPFDKLTVPFLNGGDLQVILRKNSTPS